MSECEACKGSGEVPSGVCHCGEYMVTGNGVHDNHGAVEMMMRCDACSTPICRQIDVSLVDEIESDGNGYDPAFDDERSRL